MIRKFYAKRFLTFLLLILSYFSLFAQTASLTEGCIPLEVQFAPPNGQTTYFWTFQTGATSTLENPTNIFVNPGSYVVEFRATTNGPVIGTVTIEVYAKPEMQLTTVDPAVGCKPLFVNLEADISLDPAISINSYNWVYGDGTANLATESSNHTYVTTGNFSISLEIETSIESCNTTTIFENVVTVSSVDDANFVTTPFPAFACEPPLEVSIFNFTANETGRTFEWDFGDTQTFSGHMPPPHTYTTADLFEITLMVTDSNGCMGNISRFVEIGTPVADFIIPDTVCIFDTIFVTNISDPGSYAWEQDETVTYFSYIINADFFEGFVFKEQGFHDVTLRMVTPDGICNAEITKSIYVDEPDASFVSDPSYACVGPFTTNYTGLSPDPIAWEWTFWDLSTSTDQNPSIELSYPDEDPFSEYGVRLFGAELIVTNPSGCRDTVFLTDTITRPDALFIPDVINGCAPLTVEFSDSTRSHEDVLMWTYTFGDGDSVELTDDGDVIHTFQDPGIYPVQLSIINEGGCVDTSYVLNIEVGDTISIGFDVDQTEICPGESIHFNSLGNTEDIDAWHFETDNGHSFHCYQEENLDWPFETSTGLMDVTLTVEYNGCYSTSTQEDLIQVNGPIAKLDYEIDCEMPFTVTFSDSSFSATAIEWDFGDGSTSTDPFTTHTYASTGDYTVILTATNDITGCPSSSDTTLVCIRDLQAIFLLPEEVICKGMALTLSASGSQDVFADCGQGYEWLFDITQRPITTDTNTVQIAFGTPGHETITLITQDINGCYDTLKQVLDIYEVRPNFSSSDSTICGGGDVPINFTDLSTADTTIVSWDWDLGDSHNSSDQNPSHIYETPFDAAPPTLLVTLTVTDAIGCSESFTVIHETYQPTSIIGSLPGVPNICEGEEVLFSASDYIEQGSHLNFNWDFSSGNMSTNQTESVIYDNHGSFPVSLHFEEEGSGCGGDLSTLVNVQSYPTADFTSSVDGQTIICHPSQINFMDNSSSDYPLAYAWDFGNNQTAFVEDPIASFAKGSFTIDLIISTSFGCMDTTSQMITLVGPEGDFNIDNTTICVGEDITFSISDTVDVSTFTWNFGDGTQLENVDPTTHTFTDLPPTGQTVVTLVYEGEDGACTFAVEHPINIRDAVAGFEIDNENTPEFCQGEIEFVNTSTGADNYQWDFGNNQFSAATNPTIDYDPGEYTVTLIATDSQYGCTDTIVQALDLEGIPNIAIMDAILCPGETITLQVENAPIGVTYLWSPAELFTDPTAQTQEITLEESMDITVVVTDEIGCFGDDISTVSVVQPIEWEAIDTTMCGGIPIEEVPLPFNDGFHIFTWSPSPPPFSPEEDAVFTLNISDVADCENNAFEYRIDVLSGDEYTVPNVFTPNNDGLNDVFKVYYNPQFDEQIQIIDFWVFNRWGEKVFQSTAENEIWDGTYKGKPAQSDIYLWRAEILLTCDGKTVIESGEINLLR